MSNALNWKSKLSLQAVFASSDKRSYPHIAQQGIISLLALQQENGRLVLEWQYGETRQLITTKSYDLKTCINEYGGKPFCLRDDELYFINRQDQAIYQQKLSWLRASEQRAKEVGLQASVPRRVSPLNYDGQRTLFADLCFSDQFVFAIAETTYLPSDPDSKDGLKGSQKKENTHRIVCFSLNQSNPELIELVAGADFYNNLVIDPISRRIAWVEWNHPNMPWDANQLWVADFEVIDSGIKITNTDQIELAQGASICQLLFSTNGNLFFVADFPEQDVNAPENYWNIYAVVSTAERSYVQAVTTLNCEFGYPHWQYGDARITQFDADYLIAIATTAAGDTLYKIHQTNMHVEEMSCGLELGDSIQNLHSDGLGRACFVRLSALAEPQITMLNRAEKVEPYFVKKPILSAKEISLAQHLEFQTRDNQRAFAYYYAPKNSAYACESQSAAGQPPLLVMVHGGPTARAYGYFDLQKQFWTQRGFAVVDINHRGSSGYGRRFRDALYGTWGETDTNDIVDAIRYLLAQGLASSEHVCIRGKSAGGYAVLRALTSYPEVFRAGACYYGIGNLLTLAETTHKFEKHYADRLIGEAYSDISAAPLASKERASKERSLFYTRSPINHIESLRSPMIIFQGLQDKVVPPQVSQEMAEALKKANIDYQYVEYADEAHGFRQTDTNIDAWSKELAFYRRVLNS